MHQALNVGTGLFLSSPTPAFTGYSSLGYEAKFMNVMLPAGSTCVKIRETAVIFHICLLRPE
jgi:hypothetical protein